jgi:hypothetical protein
VRTKRTKRTKRPRTGFRRGGSVRLKRLMRHKPPFRVERGWDDCFSSNSGCSSPTAGPVSGQIVVPSCQRAVHRKRSPGRTPAHRAIICSLCGPAAGRRNTEWGVVNQFCLTMHSLRGPRNDAAVSAEGAPSTRAFCKLVAAARKRAVRAGQRCRGEAAPEYELLLPQ